MDRTYGAVSALWSEPSPEGIQSLLHHDELTAKVKMSRYLEAGLSAWYSDDSKPVIVDKGRYWINHLDALKATHPSSRVICTVRNPLNCFASIQQLHLQYPVLKDGPPNEPLYARTLRYFNPETGMLGSNLVRVEDKLALPKRWPNLVYVVFEEPPILASAAVLWPPFSMSDSSSESVLSSTHSSYGSSITSRMPSKTSILRAAGMSKKLVSSNMRFIYKRNRGLFKNLYVSKSYFSMRIAHPTRSISKTVPGEAYQFRSSVC